MTTYTPTSKDENEASLHFLIQGIMESEEGRRIIEHEINQANIQNSRGEKR